MQIENIRVYQETPLEIRQTVSLCFVTDGERFDLVSYYGLESERIKTGAPFNRSGFIQRCLSEEKTIVSTFESIRQGEIIKSWITPTVVKGRVKGACGIITSSCCAPEDIVDLWLDTTPEEAVTVISEGDKIHYCFYLNRLADYYD